MPRLRREVISSMFNADRDSSSGSEALTVGPPAQTRLTDSALVPAEPRKQLGICSVTAQRRGCWRSPAVPCRRCRLNARLALCGLCVFGPSRGRGAAADARVDVRWCRAVGHLAALGRRGRGGPSPKDYHARQAMAVSMRRCAEAQLQELRGFVGPSHVQPNPAQQFAAVLRFQPAPSFCTLVQAVDLDSLLLVRIAPVVGHRSPASAQSIFGRLKTTASSINNDMSTRTR